MNIRSVGMVLREEIAMALHLERGALDLSFTDIDLRQALDTLFQQMHVAYVLLPEVQGIVSINLHNATIEQALHALLGGAYTYTIGPHDVIYIHRAGTTWRPGNEKID
jgi:type II secretory pathway component HofQ